MTIWTCPKCGRYRLLDLFSGGGGAGRGYQLAGFCTTAVDTDHARLTEYPGSCPGAETIPGDALTYTLDEGHTFAAIHASPPCTGYSRGTTALPDRLHRYDRLIGVTRDVLREVGRPWVLENVEDARSEMPSALTLCWTMFHRPGSILDNDGTPLWMRRHRLFESSEPLMSAGGCDHRPSMQCAGAYGGARRDKVEARTIRRGGYVPQLSIMRDLLGTPWLSEKGCQLAIPPAYTEFLGEQLLALGLCEEDAR